MTKSDAQLQREVLDELYWDPAVAAGTISVAVRAGAVVMRGRVETRARRLAAIRAAERVAGVRSVEEELRVDSEPFDQRSLEPTS